MREGRVPPDIGQVGEMTVERYLQAMREMSQMVYPILSQQQTGMVVLERGAEVLRRLEEFQEVSPGEPRFVGMSPDKTAAKQLYALFSRIKERGEYPGLWSEQSRHLGQLEYANVMSALIALSSEKEFQTALAGEMGLPESALEFRGRRTKGRIDILKETMGDIAEVRLWAQEKAGQQLLGRWEEFAGHPQLAERGVGGVTSGTLYGLSATQDLINLLGAAQEQGKEARWQPISESVRGQVWGPAYTRSQMIDEIVMDMAPMWDEALEKVKDESKVESMIPDFVRAAARSHGVEEATPEFVSTVERVFRMFKGRSLARFWVDFFGTKTFFPDLVKEWESSAPQAYPLVREMMRKMRREMGYEEFQRELFGKMGVESFQELVPRELHEMMYMYQERSQVPKLELETDLGWGMANLAFGIRAIRKNLEETQDAMMEGESTDIPTLTGGELLESELMDRFGPRPRPQAWPWARGVSYDILKGVAYDFGRVPRSQDEMWEMLAEREQLGLGRGIRYWSEIEEDLPSYQEMTEKFLPWIQEMGTRMVPAMQAIQQERQRQRMFEQLTPERMVEGLQAVERQLPTPETATIEAEIAQVIPTVDQARFRLSRERFIERIMREQVGRELREFSPFTSSEEHPGLEASPGALEAMTGAPRVPVVHIHEMTVQTPDLEGAVREAGRNARVRAGGR